MWRTAFRWVSLAFLGSSLLLVVFLEVYWGGVMPRTPDVPSGRVRGVVLNHGPMVYVTANEEWVLDAAWWGLLAAAAVSFVETAGRTNQGRTGRPGHRDDAER